jgi:hypothetical protein
MAGNQRIDSVINKQSVDKELQDLISGLKTADELIRKMPEVTVNYKKSEGLSDLKKNTDELVKVNQQAKKTQDDLTLSVKQYESILNQNAQAQAKYNAGQSDASKALAATKEQLRQQNLETKNQTIVQQAAEGSIQKMRAELSLLTGQYDKMSAAQRNSPAGNALQLQIKGQVEALKQLEGETGRYQRNVGNYTGAVAILEKALQEVKQKIDDFTKSGKTNGEQLGKFRQEEALLEQALNKNAKGFSSITMEVRANERALATMFEQGMQGSEAYNQLQKQTANAKRELAEFNEQQKLMSSQTPVISAAMLAAKGLAGAYAVGAGAAALFGDENGKVEKELQKLVAIMTVLQGLQEVHELLEKKGTIAKIAGTVATKAQVLWQRVLSSTMLQSAAATTILRIGIISLTGGLLLLVPLIAFGAQKISEAKDSTEGMGKKMKSASVDVKVLNDAMSHANDAYVEAKKSLNDVRTALDYAKEGIISKQKAVDIYNESVGKTMGQVNSLKEAEDKLSDPKAVQAYVDMMLYKAAANYALEEASKKAYEAELKHNKAIENAANVNKKGEAEKDKASGAEGLSEFLSSGLKNEADKAKEDADNAVKSIEDVATTFQNRVKEIAKKFNFDPTGGKGDKKDKPKSTLSDQNKLEDETRKAQFETKKQLMIDEMNMAQRIADNDKISFAIRMAAAQRFFDVKKQIAEAQKKFDLTDINTKEAEDIKVAESEKKGQDVINKIKANAAAQRKLIEAKSNTDLIAINADRTTKEREMFIKHQDEMKKLAEEKEKELAAHKQSQHEIDLQNISNGYEAELLKLDQAYAKKKKHTEKEEKAYALAKLKLQEEFQIKSLQADIAFTKETLDLADARAKASGKQEDIDAVAKAKGQLAALETKLASTITQFKLDQNKKLNSDDEDVFNKKMARLEKYAAYAKQVEEIIGGFVQNSIDKQKNALQDKQDLIDKNYEKEVANISASTLSEEDKANRLKILEAQKFAQTEQIDRKKRQLDLEKAKFDKAANIASIIGETALAVIRALGSKPWTPANIALAAITGAIGAAQLVKAIATPLPRYAGGRTKSDTYEGLALAGEVRPELLKRKDGSMELINKPSIVDVRKGDEIFPDVSKFTGPIMPFDEVNKILLQTMMRNTLNMIAAPDLFGKKIDQLKQENKEMLIWQTEQLKEAYKNSRQPINISISDFKNSDYINKSVRE